MILSEERGFVVANKSLKIMMEVSGVEVKDILVTGTAKRVIIGTLTPQGQLLLWNFEKELEEMEEISF